MPAKDLVSVLIPVYNHEKYISQAILSVINQTYKNIELIIINDGSTDNTAAKIKELSGLCRKRFSGFIFKTQKNKRICYTENRLVNMAHGKYCFFLDADDIIKPYTIYDLHKFLSGHSGYALVSGDNEFIDENSKVFYLDKHRKHTYSLTDAVYKTRAGSLAAIRTDLKFKSKQFGTYSTLVRENYILNGFMVKTDAVKFIGGFKNEASIWDNYLMLQLSKYFKFKYIDKVFYSYRCYSGNDTVSRKWFIANSVVDTLMYEINLIRNIDLSKLNKDAQKCIKSGIAEFILKTRLKNFAGYRNKLKKQKLTYDK